MPPSEGGETLFERLVGFENLYRAAGEARRGKRYKAAPARFHRNLAENLVELRDELLGGRYRPGGSSAPIAGRTKIAAPGGGPADS